MWGSLLSWTNLTNSSSLQNGKNSFERILCSESNSLPSSMSVRHRLLWKLLSFRYNFKNNCSDFAIYVIYLKNVWTSFICSKHILIAKLRKLMYTKRLPLVNLLFHCRHRLQYWKDPFNCLDLVSSLLLVSVIPFRFFGRQEQWPCFSVGYLLYTLRIFKYAAVFRFEIFFTRKTSYWKSWLHYYSACDCSQSSHSSIHF